MPTYSPMSELKQRNILLLYNSRILYYQFITTVHVLWYILFYTLLLRQYRKTPRHSFLICIVCRTTKGIIKKHEWILYFPPLNLRRMFIHFFVSLQYIKWTLPPFGGHSVILQRCKEPGTAALSSPRLASQLATPLSYFSHSMSVIATIYISVSRYNHHILPYYPPHHCICHHITVLATTSPK